MGEHAQVGLAGAVSAFQLAFRMGLAFEEGCIALEYPELSSYACEDFLFEVRRKIAADGVKV